MRDRHSDPTNWNSLWLNPNSVLERVSKKLNISKAEVIKSDELAPKIALAEAEILEETKKWLKEKGLRY